MTSSTSTSTPTSPAVKNPATVGAVIVAIAVLWQGIGTALISHTISPTLGTYSTFTAFLLAAIIGTIAKVIFAQRTPSGASKAPWMSRTEVLILNLVTAGAFACFYVAATLIPATAASVIETGLGPIAIALALLTTTRNSRALVHPAIVVLAAAAVAIAVFSATPVEPVLKVAGIVLSTIAGACAAGVLLISRRLASRGIDALSISASRFHLAWILCGAIALPTVINTHQSVETLAGAAGVSVIGISLPILLLQWGITKAKPLASAFIISALPAIVLAADTLLGAALTPTIAGTMLILVLILLAGLRQPRKGQAK